MYNDRHYLAFHPIFPGYFWQIAERDGLLAALKHDGSAFKKRLRLLLEGLNDDLRLTSQQDRTVDNLNQKRKDLTAVILRIQDLERSLAYAIENRDIMLGAPKAQTKLELEARLGQLRTEYEQGLFGMHEATNYPIAIQNRVDDFYKRAYQRKRERVAILFRE